MFDDRMLQFLARLSEMHVDPTISDPRRIEEVPDDALSEDEGRPQWLKDDMQDHGTWSGLFKDIGIYTEYDWHFIMCKCLASMGRWLVPLHTFTVQSFMIDSFLQKSLWQTPGP